MTRGEGAQISHQGPKRKMKLPKEGRMYATGFTFHATITLGPYKLQECEAGQISVATWGEDWRNTMDQNRAETLPREAVWSTRRVEIEE